MVILDVTKAINLPVFINIIPRNANENYSLEGGVRTISFSIIVIVISRSRRACSLLFDNAIQLFS